MYWSWPPCHATFHWLLCWSWLISEVRQFCIITSTGKSMSWKENQKGRNLINLYMSSSGYTAFFFTYHCYMFGDMWFAIVVDVVNHTTILTYKWLFFFRKLVCITFRCSFLGCQDSKHLIPDLSSKVGYWYILCILSNWWLWLAFGLVETRKSHSLWLKHVNVLVTLCPFSDSAFYCIHLHAHHILRNILVSCHNRVYSLAASSVLDGQ